MTSAKRTLGGTRTPAMGPTPLRSRSPTSGVHGSRIFVRTHLFPGCVR
ncbi:hypothetical protein ABIF79_005837 [Bradyrhizobium japonicum]